MDEFRDKKAAGNASSFAENLSSQWLKLMLSYALSALTGSDSHNMNCLECYPIGRVISNWKKATKKKNKP